VITGSWRESDCDVANYGRPLRPKVLFIVTPLNVPRHAEFSIQMLNTSTYTEHEVFGNENLWVVTHFFSCSFLDKGHEVPYIINAITC